MSFAPHSDSEYGYRRQRKPADTSKVQKQVAVPTPLKQSVSRKRVEKLPPPEHFNSPVWRALLFVQKSSSIFAFALVCLTLFVYAWTVYSQQLWSKEYQKLQYLQSMERQLTKTLSSMENYHAEQAEKPNSGLTHSRPLVISPSNEQPAMNPPEKSASEPAVSGKSSPLGY